MNSIEAMRTVTDRPRVLTISLQSVERAGILVAVGDTGPGLDPAIADCISSPFSRPSLTAWVWGWSIFRPIIEAYGGRIWASRREVCGTVLRFIMPAATELGGVAHTPGNAMNR